MSEKLKIATFETSDDTPDPEKLAWAFPDVKPGMVPYGARVVVQLRRVKKKTDSGLFLPTETQENEK